jgi:hypothetical protein
MLLAKRVQSVLFSEYRPSNSREQNMLSITMGINTTHPLPLDDWVWNDFAMSVMLSGPLCASVFFANANARRGNISTTNPEPAALE